ncbi:MAG TPA: flagellar motor protein MotB [Actinotalea sp.]
MSAGHGSGGHGRSRRRPAEEHEEAENHERWAVSYADMMTVLLGLFIVLYAMSQIDQIKFEALRDSLAAGFGQQAPSMMQGATGALTGVQDFQVVPDLVGETGIEKQQIQTAETQVTEDDKNLQLAQVEYQRLDGVAEAIQQALATQALADRVRFRITERGLVIGMVADDVFFSQGSADLTETSRRVLDTMAPVIAGLPDEVSIEGHANTIPVSGRYATNWELSSDRATQVLRRLVEFGGVPAPRIAAVGFGDARPLADTGGLSSIEADRRVDLVILSGATDAVRSFLPSLSSAQG